ncbi:alpha/beta-tubulin-N-acetyltransferase 9-like [Artemia franciscana]|uniref:N-acetyltransferase domain-containing protein n=1 Tax=Artemia franciscana TaxID=6661 RepID=A0AA88KSP2_ARTSF|nr:hypothetical protein QYM36_017174 [Artemia franciscana]
MKLNQNTKLTNRNVVLVPYEAYHVPKYHTWMQSEELQKLTASEPLTLEEEFEMQQTWRKDEDKCTFIILDGDILQEKGDEIEAMVGDVNLFIAEEEEGRSAEIEIMVAEPKARGKKIGWNATLSMIRYGIEQLEIQIFTSKIGYDNETSQRLFKRLKFTETNRVDIFQEIHYNCVVDDNFTNWIRLQTSEYSRNTYESLI